MKTCEHPNCSPLTKAIENGLCKHHLEEYINSGKEGHWKCTWCENYKKEVKKNE